MVPIASHFFSEFHDIVLDGLKGPSSKSRTRQPIDERERQKNREKEYQIRVATQLRAYRQDILKDEVGTVTDNTWSEWIDELGLNLDKQKSKCLEFKRGTINDLARGDALLLKAVVAHYRLHMHVFADHMKYASKLDDFVFDVDASPFSGPLFTFESVADTDIRSYAFAEIDNPGWTQQDKGADEVELAAKIRLRVHNREHKGRDLQYGLNQAYMSVVAKNFEVTHEYCSFLDKLRGSYQSEGDCQWYMTGPCDNKKMLRGFAVADQICTAKPIGEGDASLKLNITARPSDFALFVTDIDSGNEVSADDREKANLIRKLFAIHLKARLRIGDGNFLLALEEVVK